MEDDVCEDERDAVAIRQIRAEDIESFYRTFAIVVRERRYLAFLEPPPFEHTRAFCLHNIEHGHPQLVAIAQGEVIGWCDITPPGRDVMAHVGVLGMALHPGWRGRRIGERLMREALAAAWQRGLSRVELGVFSHNARARALYRKVGFAEEGVKRRRIRIDGVLHDEIMMAILRE
jgi:RimJ/RimL family protein N-acetyltransferase